MTQRAVLQWCKTAGFVLIQILPVSSESILSLNKSGIPENAFWFHIRIGLILLNFVLIDCFQWFYDYFKNNMEKSPVSEDLVCFW